jgi:GDPmannose 4,6-dehydratase
VRHDPRYHRPTEVDHLRGDASRARETLGWRPRVSFSELIGMMVDADVALARQERMLADAGHNTALRGLASS